MLTESLNALNPDSRIWLFTADRTIKDEEKSLLLEECQQFLGQWAAHGSELKAAADLIDGHLLIIAADESFQMASGCSIDSAVRFVKDLGQKFNIDFFDRTKLLFKPKGEIKSIKLNELSTQIAEGNISPETPFYNTNITSLKELKSSLIVKAEESWLKRYFKAIESV